MFHVQQCLNPIKQLSRLSSRADVIRSSCRPHQRRWLTIVKDEFVVEHPRHGKIEGRYVSTLPAPAPEFSRFRVCCLKENRG